LAFSCEKHEEFVYSSSKDNFLKWSITEWIQQWIDIIENSIRKKQKGIREIIQQLQQEIQKMKNWPKKSCEDQISDWRKKTKNQIHWMQLWQKERIFSEFY
jgi:hypothetical protein